MDVYVPPDRPLVSILIATRNEDGFITGCLEPLARQTYPRACMQIVLIDGCSTDDTVSRALAWAAREGVDLQVIENPQRITPAAFNRGLAVARGEVIIILGARARVAPDFVEASVATLERSGADVVGGVVRTVAGTDDAVARAIALAQRTPFGVGDAQYRYADHECEPDTVNYGAYRREVFDRIGHFDESLQWAEDCELNYRLRAAGGRLVLDPAIHVDYIARPTLRALWRQRFLWGLNKPRVAERHAAQMRPRHVVPGLFVLALYGGAALWPAGGRWRWPLVGTLGAYVLAMLAATLRLGARFRWKPETALLPLAFATMHLAYGWGTLAGLAALAGRLISRRCEPLARSSR